MAGRGLGLRFWVVGILATSTSCTGDTPLSDIGPPNIDLIMAFYPVNGKVVVNGLPESMPREATHVYVKAHPTGTSELGGEVMEDGSFEVDLFAVSDDVLEISATTEDGSERGQIAYLTVPPSPFPPIQYVCCLPTGTCQKKSAAENEETCPDPTTGITRCIRDGECGELSGETLPINEDSIEITPPNSGGRIKIKGVVPPRSLVVLENRGKSTIGFPDRPNRLMTISDDLGVFEFPPNSTRRFAIQADGDDEIVIQAHDLWGLRTPQSSKLVPDAELEGVDAVGAYPYEALYNGQPGIVALRFAPYGIDKKGICPNAADNPVLCFTGGLTYDMVGITSAALDDQHTIIPTPTPTSTVSGRFSSRATEGDIRQGPQMIMVVLDMTAGAHSKDSAQDPLRIAATLDFICGNQQDNKGCAGLRSRDYVGLVTFGRRSDDTNGATVFEETSMLPPEDRSDVQQRLLGLKEVIPLGEGNVLSAVRVASNVIKRSNAAQLPARIVVITLSDIPGDETEAEADLNITLDAIGSDQQSGFAGHTVDVIAVAMDNPNGGNTEFLKDLAAFTGGRYSDIPSLTESQLEVGLSGLRGRIAGSFIMLYTINFPKDCGGGACTPATPEFCCDGKSFRLSFEADVTIGNQTKTAKYEGPLRIRGRAEP